MHYEDSPDDLSPDDCGSSRIAANQCARELASQRAHGKVPDDPVTPVVPSTPMLAAHIYGESSMIGDLELAANLGKALLIANRKLEAEVKENQTIIDDQSQEITYLTKQTSALREANESRLKIYEQLEISIQDLEESNQRFKAENLAEKKKTKVFQEAIDQLETKCEQLHKDLADCSEKRGRTRTQSHAKDERYRRSVSCENNLQVSGLSNEEDLSSRLEEMEAKLKEVQTQRLLEVRKREDLEVELACSTQDNELLREQLAVFKEREDVLKSIEEDFSSFDDTSSGFCRKCNNLLETVSNHTLQDMDDIEEDDIDNIRGPCSLFRLRNGGYAYGSHESLVSIGKILNSEESSPSSVAQTESQPNSLFSELNVEYWSAMNKCEKLIKQREVQNGSYTMDSSSNGGPCNRCSTCTCDLKQEFRAKSILEEFSEVESASSGFSELENKFSSKYTQTDEPMDEVTPTVTYRPIVEINESSSSTPALPEYRKILHEVYYNIKQIVDHDKLSGFKSKSFHQEDYPTARTHSPVKLEEANVASEMPNTTDHETNRPQRPETLEIDPVPVNKQKRRKRNKKPTVCVKGEANPSNDEKMENAQFNHLAETSVNTITDKVESPKAPSSTRRDKPRRGCPHKIRSRNKTRHQIIENRQVVDAPKETVKISHPSVEVAKLRKLEMTYAEALKKMKCK